MLPFEKDTPEVSDGLPFESSSNNSQEPSIERFSNKSFLGRVGDVVGGVFEPTIDMVVNTPNFIESTVRKGITYGKDYFSDSGISLDTERRAQEAASNTLIPRYDAGTETGKLAMKGISNIFEWGIGTFGTGIAGIESIRQAVLTGKPLTKEQFEIAENIGRLGAESAMVLGVGKGLYDIAKRKPETKPTEELPIQENVVDTTKYNQMELPFEREPSAIPPGVRSPYNLTPEQIARAEAELNPATEQRIAGQGELFTGERALTPDEALARKFPLEEPQIGARDRVMSPEAERLTMDTPARVGELESRVGPPEQAIGGFGDQRALPFPDAMADSLGGMGEAALSGRERRGIERDRAAIGRNQLDQEPIPYRPVRGPGRRQGGVVDPALLTFGISRLIRERGARETINRFVGTFSKEALSQAVRNAKDPKSRETLVWMKPDDFHRLSNSRHGYEDISPDLRKSIREGLKTDAGLSDVPFLQIDSEGRVHGHEGRHRMDVFKEQGIDLVPVRLVHDTFRWGERDVSERPRLIKAQDRADDPSFSITLPTLVMDQVRQQEVLSKHRPMSKQTGAWNPFDSTRKSIAKDGVAQTLQDMKKLYLYDKRPLKQVVAEEGISGESLRDLAPTDQALGSSLERLLQKGLSSVAIDRTMAILSQNKGPVGKLIKWVVDNQHQINVSSKVRMEENTKAALDPWKKLKRVSETEVRQMLDTWLPRIGKEALTEADFKNTRQWEVFKAIRDTFNDGWKRVNAKREAAGLKPIPRIDNYFPAIREGDYWVHVIDSTGQLRWSSAYKTKYAAEYAHKMLQKEFGNEFTVKPVKLRQKGKYDLSSFDAFEETLRALSDDDPVRNAIQTRYAELIGRRGFGKTGIMRKDIEGALGFEKGWKGIHNAEHVIETYITRQESYIANLERAKMQRELRQEIPAAVWDKMPIAKDYIDLYLEKSRGAVLDQLPMVQSIAEAVSTSVGFGRNTPREFIKGTSSLASLLWLATPRFLMTQLVQHMNALPKMVELAQADHNIKNPVHAYFNGWKETFSPDNLSIEGRKWALKNGYLESTIVSLLEMKMTDLRGEKWKAVGDAIRFGMGKLEQNAVRTPVFHMFETALRDAIPNKAERFEMAANMMDYYMVHYSREASPIVYDQLGLVGEAARPLKQYAHNNFGQFLEYLQTVKDTKSVTPLATYLGVQTLVGGMKGVILVAEATAIITAINTLFGQDIPTPEQLLLESGVSDSLIFGGYSTMTGYDLSSSLAAPSVPNMFSFPPADFTATAVKDMGNYIIKKIKGTETDQDAMKAWLAVSPTAMRGWIEAYFSEPGKPIPKPTDKMRGEFPAPDRETNPTDYFNRFGLGLKSIDEARMNMMVRATKQLLARDAERKLGALDAIVDRVKNNQEPSEELIMRYINEGGDMSQLSQNIVRRMRELEMTWEERNQSRPASPAQAHRLETMRRFMDESESPAKKMSSSGLDSEGNIRWNPKNKTHRMQFEEWRAAAKRMYPNDIEKQKQFLDQMKEDEDATRSETLRLKEMGRRRHNTYMEM